MWSCLTSRVFAVSSGAACSNMKEEPSHVLLAMGVEKNIAQTAVRASLGPATKNDDINRFVAVIDEIINRPTKFVSNGRRIAQTATTFLIFSYFFLFFLIFLVEKCIILTKWPSGLI